MKTLEIELEIKSLAKKIAKATDNNDHTGAAVLLANFVGGKYPRLVKAVETIHDIEGHMPYEVGQYRRDLIRGMISRVYILYGHDKAKILDTAF